MSKFRDIVLIVKDLSQITADLLKYQVDQIAALYKDTLTRLLTWLLLTLIAALLALGGLGFILWAAQVQLASVAGPVASAIIIGSGLIMVAVIIFLLARNKLD